MNYATYVLLILFISFNLMWYFQFTKIYCAAWKFQNPLWMVNYGYTLWMIVAIFLTLR